MIAVQVTYTVNENFVSRNKENIAAFLEDFKLLDAGSFSYTTYQKADSNTFTHLSNYKDEDIQQRLLNVPAFLAFQKQRDENLLGQPAIEVLRKVGSCGSYHG